MHVEILTMESILLSTEAKSVVVPGQGGKFEMLNNHAPIISILEKGHIKVVDNNNEEKLIEINGGSIEMSHNKITILAQES
ncbi:MAG: hypothetical protein CMD26_06245 [Flavobacteriales bacterium]|nr:hypothetical protein [Flavobacteriales bacterium]|tara:strand:+ start:165 stop:407 length:243 start_codon:yes stop_codon:yes gene_type:complete